MIKKNFQLIPITNTRDILFLRDICTVKNRAVCQKSYILSIKVKILRIIFDDDIKNIERTFISELSFTLLIKFEK